MTKPAVLMHPPLPQYAHMLPDYEMVHWPPARHDIRAAIAIGTIGLTNEMLDALPNLGAVIFLGSGYERLDLDYCKARGIAVTRARNANSEDVADTAIGLIIAVARSFTLGDRMVREGEWAPPLKIAKPQRRLRGKKLGVVGYGDIGAAIAHRAEAFGMEIKWNGPRPKPDARHPYEANLLKLAQWADILAIAARGDQAGLISAPVIDALGPNGILVNVSRGAVVDEDALIAALKAGRLAGAGLDVFAQEPTPPERWANVPNTTLLPHLGGSTDEALLDSWENVRQNLRRFYAGEPLFTPLAF
jgi:lactate dehydrogenase-like 2-hydroxyacid dehydrogenase